MPASPDSPPQSKTPWLLLALLVLATVAISLLWSHVKLIDQDEMFVWQTDSVRSFADLLRVQRHYPISLDPLVYHAAVHALSLFASPGLALRLPSIFGFVLLQLCLFCYVRRASGSATAGLVAAAIPFATSTAFFATQGRPYGLLLGLCAWMLLCYQSATRNPAEAKPRSWALVGLFLSIALVLNTHYFAVLLLIPIYAAEAARTLARKRFDLPVIAAILLGTAAEAGTLPFQKAAKEFKVHYYNVGAVSLHAITQGYRSLFIDYTDWSLRTQHILAACFLLAALVFAALLALRWKRLALPTGEGVFLLTLAALPFFGFLLARFVTHSVEVRYVLCALVALSALIALLTSATLKARTNYALFAALLVITLAASYVRVHSQQEDDAGTLERLVVPSSLHDALAADPTARVYIQQMDPFDIAQFYAPDPLVRSRVTLVYSFPLEIQYTGHDTYALTGDHMRYFTSIPTVTYESLPHNKPLLFVLYHSSWDYTDQAFAHDHATVTPITEWNDGTLAHVTLP